MESKDALVVFEGTKIRRTWHEEQWYFSVVDIIQILTESDSPRQYWGVLKKRDIQLLTICLQLKLPSSDGKYYNTDCVNTEDAFRLIQSIPSPKAEPFKRWLAHVGFERIKEIEDPELAQERMKVIYEQKGYSKSWIDKRLRGIAVRQDLTDEWQNRGVNEHTEFAILTAEISKASFGLTPSEYKNLKGLNNENLRDHMTDLELIFSMLGEASTSEIERTRNPETFNEHKKASKDGGTIAKNARLELEQKTKQNVITGENYLKEPEKKKRIEMK